MNSLIQYKLLYTILNGTEVYDEPVARTKKILHCAVKFEAGEENRIVYESWSVSLIAGTDECRIGCRP